eukprot:998040-Amorphochlora_amoeboformis.AAC.1
MCIRDSSHIFHIPSQHKRVFNLLKKLKSGSVRFRYSVDACGGIITIVARVGVESKGVDFEVEFKEGAQVGGVGRRRVRVGI